jgi:hypothetical protein
MLSHWSCLADVISLLTTTTVKLIISPPNLRDDEDLQICTLFENVGAPQGRLDLSFHSYSAMSVNACLTGKRQDGAPFEACDLLSH